MNDGWIKSSRSLLDSAVFQDAYLLKTWIYLLHVVTHKPLPRILDGKAVTLKPGQYITSTRKLSEALNMSLPTVTKHLKMLEELGNISRKFVGNNTIITVENWSRYQSESEGVKRGVKQGVKRGVKRGVKSNLTQVFNEIEQKQEYVQENNNNNSDDASIEKLNAVAVNESFPSKEIIEQLNACHFEISTRNLEELRKLEDSTSCQWVLDAIKIADDRNIRNVSFVRKVVQNWKADGQQSFTREASEEKKKADKEEKKRIQDEHLAEYKAHIPELFEELGEYPSYEFYKKRKGWDI